MARTNHTFPTRTFYGSKGLGRQAERRAQTGQQAVLSTLVGGPEPQHRVTVADQVGHEEWVELRVVQGLRDGGAAVLAGVVHTLEPVVREVLAEHRQKDGL